MKLDRKKEIVEELHEKFARSKVVVVADYKGLDVQTINALRKSLTEQDLEMKVVKNTLLIKASQETDVSALQDHFKGPSAVILSYEDPVTPAKVLTEFAKGNEKFEIKAGVMGGKLMDNAALKALSNLPSREVLLSQVLSAMNAVPTSLVRALNDIPRRMLNVLTALEDQKKEKEAA